MTPSFAGSSKAFSVSSARIECFSFLSSSMQSSIRLTRLFCITTAEKIAARFTHDTSLSSFTTRSSASAGPSSTCARSASAASAARHPVARSPIGFSLPRVATTFDECDERSAATSAA